MRLASPCRWSGLGSLLGMRVGRFLRCWGLQFGRMAPEDTGRKQVVPQKRRTKGGTFAPGQSGNPSGRPPGSRNEATILLDQLLDGEGDAILRTVIAAAKDSKPWAARLTVERLVPLRRDRRIRVPLGSVATAQDVATAVADVIGCASRGEISLEEAKSFMQLLEQQRRSIETMDIAARLEMLEQAPVEGVKRRVGYRIPGRDDE